MSVAVILVIIVASGGGQSPAARGLIAASSETLGAGVSVQIHEAAVPSDDEAARIEAATAPRAVAELLWLDDAQTRAHLRLHVARTDRWIDRVIAFASADNPSERGRTLGFALASMLPEADPALQVREAPAAELAAQSPAAPSAVSLQRSVGVVAVVDAGGGGSGAGVGGAADLAYAFNETWAIRLCLELWRGSISEIAAADRTAHVGAGGTWTLVAPTSLQRWGLGLGADALVVYQGVSHVHTDGTTEWKDKILPGIDLRIDGRRSVTRNLEIVASAGPEVAFGTVQVAVVTSTITKDVTLPALRGVAQLGVRLIF
jgi:hypothetical protein